MSQKNDIGVLVVSSFLPPPCLCASILLIQVGAGPVGLTTALVLAKNGVRIRVIDKLANVAVGQRGSGIAVSVPSSHSASVY